MDRQVLDGDRVSGEHTMEYLIDYLLHFDRHLTAIAAAHGGWLYALLFVIVFAETGLIVTPSCPGTLSFLQQGRWPAEQRSISARWFCCCQSPPSPATP